MITKANIISHDDRQKVMYRHFGQSSDDYENKLIWKGETFFHHLDLDNTDINSILNNNKFIIVKCNMICINKKIITLKSIYNIDNTYIVFYKKWKYINIVKILSKNANEMLATGIDENGDYSFPLVLNIDKNNSCYLNL